MSLRLTLAIATLASCVAVQAAAADRQSPDDVISVRVRTNDIDPATDAGARILLRRIYTAAHQACGGEPSQTAVEMLRPHNTCVLDAVTRTIAGLNSQRLAALDADVRRQAHFIQ